MLNEKKKNQPHTVCISVYICLWKSFFFTISLIHLFHTFGYWTELNTFAVISYTEVKLLILVRSEKKQKEFVSGQTLQPWKEIRWNHLCSTKIHCWLTQDKITEVKKIISQEGIYISYKMRNFCAKTSKVFFAISWYLSIFRK